MGCAPSVEVPRPTPAELPEIVPRPSGGITSRSIRIHSRAESVRLFEGKLSARQIDALAQGETSETLAKRELELVLVPPPIADAGASAAPSDTPATWLPTRLLGAATSYSVVADRASVTFTTLADEVALVRVWPERPIASQAVFCLDSELSQAPLGNADTLLELDAVSFGQTVDGGFESAPGFTALAHQPACWFWLGRSAADPRFGETDAGDARRETPAAGWPGAAVQPTWYARSNAEIPVEPQCSPGELAVGPACALVEDDRLLVRGGDDASFWRVHGDASAWFVLAPGRSGVVRGLTPGKPNRLTFTIHAALGEPLVHTVTVTTPPSRPHIVINEVMADPVGREPDQEWIELYNDGTTVVNMDGWTLADEGGEMKLPGVSLAPSGYALLVNDTYVTNAPGEPVPEPNVLMIRLPVLAKSGLSNSGEALRLLDNSDMVVASFPGAPKPSPGVSVARGAPWLVDEPSAFGLHALPGATPGAPNRLRAGSTGEQ